MTQRNQSRDQQIRLLQYIVLLAADPWLADIATSLDESVDAATRFETAVAFSTLDLMRAGLPVACRFDFQNPQSTPVAEPLARTPDIRASIEYLLSRGLLIPVDERGHDYILSTQAGEALRTMRPQIAELEELYATHVELINLWRGATPSHDYTPSPNIEFTVTHWLGRIRRLDATLIRGVWNDYAAQMYADGGWIGNCSFHHVYDKLFASLRLSIKEGLRLYR